MRCGTLGTSGHVTSEVLHSPIDCNIYVRSRRAAYRVKHTVTRFLETQLKLKVNEAKSAVAKPRECSFLGFSIGRNGMILISEKTIKRLKQRVRETTQRTRGRP